MFPGDSSPVEEDDAVEVVELTEVDAVDVALVDGVVEVTVGAGKKKKKKKKKKRINDTNKNCGVHPATNFFMTGKGYNIMKGLDQIELYLIIITRCRPSKGRRCIPDVEI